MCCLVYGNDLITIVVAAHQFIFYVAHLVEFDDFGLSFAKLESGLSVYCRVRILLTCLLADFLTFFLQTCLHVNYEL